MNSNKVDEPDGLSDIYTSFSEIRYELLKRRANKKLLLKVKEFFGSNIFDKLGEGPHAVLSRSIATANTEMMHYLDLCRSANLSPLILEYPDKFVAKNPDKYHLCKLFFIRRLEGRNPIVVDTSNIINFNKEEGRSFKEIQTIWGENIVDFHHRILLGEIPHLSDKIVDFSEWFSKTRTLSRYYYLYYLALFVCNGVLFENFLCDDREEATFIREKLLPSYKAVEKIFGVRPLIYRLLPYRYATRRRWYSYPEALKDYVKSSFPVKELSPQTNIVLERLSRNHLRVLADENIKKGSIIRKFDGEVISFEECIRRIKLGQEKQTDSLQIELELDMDLDEISRAFRHSCAPNSGLCKSSQLIAIRDISKGEEITYDYSSTVGPNIPSSLWEMRCNCGSNKCRKILKNVLSIPREQLSKYNKAGALQDYIQRELKIINELGGKLPKYKRIEF